ncbi:CPBP family intramembrane glutamic endopeptidase [Halobellus rufus]|uniref:CPBP family intramembrane glutamic endopeptidase n=1 Tax=Halobellus rufus TaxID=1448860 RepID=UPI0006790296|nr:type II CAAX endopeptidase family protein [Halobellus rufus]
MASITKNRQRKTETSAGRRSARTFLTAVALLTVSSFGGLLIIEGFSRLQVRLGLGDSFALTFLVGGGLATLWFAFVGVAYLRFRPVTIHYDLRWPTIRDGGWILGGLAAIITASLLTEIVVSQFGSGSATNISSAAAVENPVLIYSVFLIGNLLLIAPIEEFLFRGVIQGRLRESYGTIAAVTITSVGFGLTHIPSYWFGGSDLLSIGVWGAVVSIAATGFILGYVYEQTNSLLTVSIIHGLVNTIGIGLALLAFL